MIKSYIDTPQSISVQSISDKGFTLSSSQYKELLTPNKSIKFVREFLSRPLKRSDLGIEIGSINYVEKSQFYFLRTKALQEYSFLPEITSETALPILPKAFKSSNLKEGDLIISKDSNIGEIVILDKDYANFMTSGAIYKLPVKENKYYLLAFIKHRIFRDQLDFLVPKGATIRHAKTMFLDCKIPIPMKKKDETIKFIEILTKAIVNKEKLIRERYAKILESFDIELTRNQKSNKFEFEFPFINEILNIGRLDTNLYRKEFKEKEFLIRNYTGGFLTLSELGFRLIRGNNLAVSVIGTSIYLDSDYPGFYKLILPKNIDKYGTLLKMEYLGNKRKLIKLQKGDIVFGAEGFEKGRSFIIFDDSDRNITNFHGMTIRHEENNAVKTTFLKCYLDYLRNLGLIDLYATGGNGGSLSQKYWEAIPFPNFPFEKQIEINSLYHNPHEYNMSKCNVDDFIKFDNKYNNQAGIYELDKTVKLLKEKLDIAIDGIINDEEVKIEF